MIILRLSVFNAYFLFFLEYWYKCLFSTDICHSSTHYTNKTKQNRHPIDTLHLFLHTRNTSRDYTPSTPAFSLLPFLTCEVGSWCQKVIQYLSSHLCTFLLIYILRTIDWIPAHLYRYTKGWTLIFVILWWWRWSLKTGNIEGDGNDKRRCSYNNANTFLFLILGLNPWQNLFVSILRLSVTPTQDGCIWAVVFLISLQWSLLFAFIPFETSQTFLHFVFFQSFLLSNDPHDDMLGWNRVKQKSISPSHSFSFQFLPLIGITVSENR